MSSLVPTIYELPFLNFGGAPVYLLADLIEGARVSWSAVGSLEVSHSGTIPIGAMLVVVGPDHARNFRPLKVGKPASPLDLAPSPSISVGPVSIPVLVDVAMDLDGTLTRGVVPGGAAIKLPVIPAGSLVAAIPPELAAQIRPGIAAALAEVQRHVAAQRGGAGGIVH